MTDPDHSFGKALFGARWQAIAQILRSITGAWRRALASARRSAKG
jgi:hypothetical protein